MRRSFPDAVPGGTHLVFRDGSASVDGLPMAVSIINTEPINWGSGQAICAISFTDFEANNTTNYCYSPSTRKYVPLCVPVGLLSLEKDWPQQYMLEVGTLYGSPEIHGSLRNRYACEWAVQTNAQDHTDLVSFNRHNIRVRSGDMWRCERILCANKSLHLFRDYSMLDDHIWFMVVGFSFTSGHYTVSHSLPSIKRIQL